MTKSKKMLSVILVLVMVLALSTPAISSSSAFAEDLPDDAPNQYLQNLYLTHGGAAATIDRIPALLYHDSDEDFPIYEQFEFDPMQTTYNLLVPDGTGNSANTAGLRVNAKAKDEFSSSGLAIRLFDPSMGNGNTTGSSILSGWAVTPSGNYPADSEVTNQVFLLDTTMIGSSITLAETTPHQMSLMIGKLPVAGAAMFSVYSDTDIYTFNIYRRTAFSNFEVSTTVDGTALTMYPSFGSLPVLRAESAYESTFVALAPLGTEEIFLTAPAVTQTDVRLYIATETSLSGYNWTEALTETGESNASPGTTPYRIDISTLDSSTGAISIPLKLAYEGAGCGVDSYYTLYIAFDDHTPVITTQPQSITPGKGDSPILSVAIEEEDGDGDLYTINYQWMRSGSSSVIGTPISGATSATYTPPTVLSGKTWYSCTVTRTVNGASFTTNSDIVSVDVQLTYLTPPVISLQPISPGSSFVGQMPGSVRCMFNDTLLDRDPDKGYGSPVGVSAKLYRNMINSYDGGICVVDYGDRAYTFQVQAPAESAAGTYYYWIELTAHATGVADATTKSNIFSITFDDISDLTLDGDGTELSPWLIKTYADLQEIKVLVDAGASLTGRYLQFANDITLDYEWEPIGALKPGTSTEDFGRNVNPFSGTLDGDGYTVTVAAGGKPLFRYVRQATVKNLNIFGAEIADAGLVTGNFIDYGTSGAYSQLYSPDTITVDNCRLLSGSKTLKSGFVHGSGSGVNNVYIINCVVEAGVIIGYDKAQEKIGSFVGNFNGMISNSISYADVYGISRVGGLVGDKSQSMGLCTIANSAFEGTITATGEWVGGIIGTGYNNITAPNTPTVTIKNCYVAADITGNNYVGGIFGGEGEVKNAWDLSSITDNFFYGEIQCNGSYYGGVIGYLRSINKNQTISNNYYLSTSATKGIGEVAEIITTSHPQYGTYGIIGGFDAATACASTSLDNFTNGMLLQKLNTSPTSYGNWVQGADYPVFSSNPVPYRITLGGDFETSYYVGDSFSAAGMNIAVEYTDGTIVPITPSEASFSGYDMNQRAVQTVTVKYGAVETSYQITVLYREDGSSGTPTTITVYFTLYGDDDHTDTDKGGTVHTLQGNNLQTWIARKSYEVSINATVWDMLKLAITEANTNGSDTFVLGNPSGNYIDKIIRNGVGLAEFTNGPNSGWMYTLNGTHPLLGVSEQFLSNNDEIVFHYTDDYTKEEGSEKWGGGTTIGDEKTPPADAPSNSVGVEIEATVKDGAAVAEVGADTVKELIAEAITEDKTNVTISIIGTQDAGTIELDMIVETVKELAKNGMSLTVTTDKASLIFDAEALKTIMGDHTDDVEVKITVSIIDTETGLTDEQKAALPENYVVIEFSVMVGDMLVHDFGGNITVSVPFTPPDGMSEDDYDLLTVYYLDENGNIQEMAGAKYDPEAGTITFTTNHFSAFLVREWINPFGDVNKGWYYKAVRFAYGESLMGGTREGAFSPDAMLTRAMLVTILYRNEGQPPIGAAAPFSDVASGQWYSDAIAWASANGIVDGYGDGRFGPNDSITREQLVTMLYNYAQWKGLDVSKSNGLSAFTDSGEVSGYAQGAMAWAVAEGLVTGRTLTTLAPKGTATRAEAATLLQRFIEEIINA